MSDTPKTDVVEIVQIDRLQATIQKYQQGESDKPNASVGDGANNQ